jgi:glucan phosphoethanolaminetransferase (alkaline phosphatase superfamily)
MGETFSRAARWAWRWKIVLLMNVFLMLPVFLYEFRIGEGGPDKTIAYILSASVLWLLTAQLVARRIWVAHAVMFPLYFVAAVDVYVVTQYKTRLSSSMLLTIFENLEDANEYLESHFSGVAWSTIVLVMAYAFAMAKIRPLKVTTPRWAPLVPLAGLVAVYLGVHHLLVNWTFVIANDRNSPFGILPQAGATYALYKESLEEARDAETFTFHARREDPPAEPELYVLVVGESSRAHNWGLYGYPRDTNPRLSKLEELLVYRDAITQAAVTRISVPLILTRGSIEDEQRTAREKSIVSAFHEVGFRTFWLSTQQRDPTTGAINRYPKEADVQRFFERRHDGVLVDAMKEMIAEYGPKERKLFFVLHTLGSHFTLTSRYPRSFNKFGDDDLHFTDRERLVNAYDNTVLYTDHILAEIIDMLRQRAGIKALLYVSDHGDNLLDDERKLFGHYHHNEYDLPIPLLFWHSKEFADAYPNKVAIAKSATQKPINTRVVFHSLAESANVVIDDPETARLSIFSPDLARYRRMVMGNPKPFDFDRWASEHSPKALLSRRSRSEPD